MTTEIRLSNAEMLQAAIVGTLRNIAAIKKALPDKHGAPEIGWNLHIEGAAGELAVARALGRHWGGSINSFKSGDDVNGLQVRTRSNHDYELILRDDDADALRFVLVTGHAPNFTIRGWIMARAGKNPEWLQTHGGRPPAFFVPHRALHEIAELRT